MIMTYILASPMGHAMALRQTSRWLIAASCWLLLALPGYALDPTDTTPPLIINQADVVGTDELGRHLPLFVETGAPKARRWVGLFYLQWHGRARVWPEYNMTEWLKNNPGYKEFTIAREGQPRHPQWYWAEPLFGYYQSTDPWVIRKHLALFADAGVDYLFLDFTNDQVYDAELTALVTVMRELRAKGVAVPKLAFFLNHEPEWKLEHLYVNWYHEKKNDDLWFRWQGKPLILAASPATTERMKKPELLAEVQNFFTFRPTWALFDATKEPTKWRFMDQLPQRIAQGPDGASEQMVVSTGLGGPLNDNMTTGCCSFDGVRKLDYDSQWLSAYTGQGAFFEQQWVNAHKAGAPMLLVTGWNELTAAVWETPGVPFLGRVTSGKQGHIVDEFNQDFNRDLEIMKDGTIDNAFMQFLGHMRRYKGMLPPQKASPMKTIAIDGDGSDWSGVLPMFRDTAGDTALRDHPSTVPHDVPRYVDRSARNDFTDAQIARDAKTVYFHIRTAAPIQPLTADKRYDDFTGITSWMMVLVDTDRNPATGWNGYDVLLNRKRQGALCSIETNMGGGWKWKRIADAPIAWGATDLEIAVPRTALGFARAAPIRFDFKWVDNLPNRPDILDCYRTGDAAPNGRLNFRYEE